MAKEIDEARRILEKSVPDVFLTLAELADRPKIGAEARRTLKRYLTRLKPLCDDLTIPEAKRKRLREIYEKFSKA